MNQKDLKSLIPEILFFTVLSIIYYYTCAETITGEDSASFHLSLIKFGINHPPGYPLYTLLGSAFVHGLSTVTSLDLSHLVNLFSAFCTLIGLVFFYLLMRKQSFNKPISLFVTAGAAFSLNLWSQANVAEVYALNLCLCVITVYFFFEFVSAIELREKKVLKPALLFSFFSGLSLSNHYPLFLLTIVPIIVFYLLHLPKEKIRDFFLSKNFIFCFCLFFVGLTPYLFMYIYVFYFKPGYAFQEIISLKDFLDFILRKSYSGVDFQNAGINAKLSYLWLSLKLVLENIRGLVFFLFMGLFTLIKEKRVFLKASLIGALGSIVLLPLVLSFPDNELFNAVFRVYPYVGYPLLLMISALGAEKLWKKNKKVAFLLLFFLVGEQFYANWPKASRFEHDANFVYGKIYLETIPKNATVILSGDEGFSLYYLHVIKKMRTDLKFVSFNNLYTKIKLFNEREYRKAQESSQVAISLRAKKIRAFAELDRPLFATEKTVFEQAKIPFEAWGFGYLAQNKGLIQSNIVKFNNAYSTTKFIEKLVPKYPQEDYWSIKNTINTSASLLAFNAFMNKDVLSEYLALKKTPRALLRKDLFKQNEIFFLQNLGYKLYEFKQFNQAIKVYAYMRQNFGLDSFKKASKYMYCHSLFLVDRKKEAQKFCF